MKKILLSIFSLFTAVSLACTFATNLAPSNKVSPETPSAPSPQAGGFSAELTQNGGVALKWEPLSGAEKYLLEIQIGEEFLPLVTLPGDQTTYEERNLPPATQWTYRLTSLTGAEKGQNRELTVETPAAVSHPLKVSLTFDQAPAALTIDPNNFDPSTIDPNNFDPSKYMAQPLTAEAVIGPEGGELTVTGSNGVVYSLNVPAGALSFATPMTLKPISGMPDLPLSGGLLAAVLIEPEALVFDLPATLTMTQPAGFPAPAGPLTLAFAFKADGQDFHLYPFAAAQGQSRVGGQLASLESAPSFEQPPELKHIKKGGGYGTGSGTAQDAGTIAENPPANAQDQTEQILAASALEEALTPLGPVDENALAPLQNEATLKLGEATRQKAGKANDWGKLMEALEDFSTYLNAGGDKINKLTDKILDRLVDQAKKLLEKNKGKCLTKDDFLAQNLVEQLSNPKDNVSQALAERFKQKYGQQLLDDLAQGKKACSFKLKMKSNIITDGSGSFVMIKANMEEIELFLRYSQGEFYLTGTGKMNEQVEFEPEGPCGQVPVSQYPNLDFFVVQLVPVFRDEQLTDFRLGFQVAGWEKFQKVQASGQECLMQVGMLGGGDYWTGQFTIAQSLHQDSSGRLRDWTLPANLKDGNGFKANWQSDVTPLKQSGLTIIDDTKFELTVTRNSK
jgi:hypothetical protein